MNFMSPPDVADIGPCDETAADGWSDIFAAWSHGVKSSMVAWPQSRDLFRASAEFAEAQRSDDEHLGIDDLVRLVMLRRLDAAAPGEIGAEASDAAALDRALDRIEGRERGGRERIEETLELARALDIDGVRRKLWICSNEFDIGDFVLLYALPLMRRVGDLWASNQISVAGEHLVSSALVSLLRSGAAPGHAAAPARLKMLVATPFGELHEIGALAACRLAQSHGFDPLYTGAQLPVYEIARLAKRNRIKVIVLGGSSAATDLQMRQLRQLAEIAETDSIIFTGGGAYGEISAPKRVAIRHCFSMRHFCCQMEIMAGLALAFVNKAHVAEP